MLAQATRTYQDEQDRMLDADIPLVAFAVILMVMYVALVLGQMPPIRSRVLLALVCVGGCVGGSLAISFGISGLAKVPYNIMSQLAFFILVAVGVDDGLILAAVWDRYTEEDGLDEFMRSSSPHNSHQVAPNGLKRCHVFPDRLSRTLREAGPSVTLTSITDALAFFIGTAIDIAAIRQFCFTSAIAVLAVLVLQITVFNAALILDE